MADNTALANALNALSATVAGIRPAAVNLKVYDTFVSDDPLDFSSWSEYSAYDKISAPQDISWNGDILSPPSFVVSLRICAREGKWNAPRDEGILTIGMKNIMTEFIPS